jgi:tetratricopeptide (TPR) repeat protein
MSAYNEAIKAFLKVDDEDHHATYYYYLGHCYSKLGNKDEAIKALTRSVELGHERASEALNKLINDTD